MLKNTVTKADSIICPFYPSGDDQQAQRELIRFDSARYTSMLISLQVPFAGNGEAEMKRASFKISLLVSDSTFWGKAKANCFCGYNRGFDFFIFNHNWNEVLDHKKN